MKTPNSVIDLLELIIAAIMCISCVVHWLADNHMQAVIDAVIVIFCITTVEFS